MAGLFGWLTFPLDDISHVTLLHRCPVAVLSPDEHRQAASLRI